MSLSSPSHGTPYHGPETAFAGLIWSAKSRTYVSAAQFRRHQTALRQSERDRVWLVQAEADYKLQQQQQQQHDEDMLPQPLQHVAGQLHKQQLRSLHFYIRSAFICSASL